MEIEGPAIRALGSLFKLTEVFIWEDGPTETRDVCLIPESTGKAPQDCEDTSSNVTSLITDFSDVPEDVELTKQMDAFGLPLSFRSNKETRKNKVDRSKRKKGTLSKLSSGDKEAKDEALECTQVSEVEIVSPIALLDNTSNSLSWMSMLGQSESYYYDVAADICDSRSSADEEFTSSANLRYGAVSDGTSQNPSNNRLECEFARLGDVASNDENKYALSTSNFNAYPSLQCQLADARTDRSEKELGGSLESESHCDSSAAHHHEEVKRFCSEDSIDQAGVSEIVELFQNSEVLECPGIESHQYNDNLRDWIVYWDSYYMRNYFYNIKTGTSTWDPPAGMEYLAFDEVLGGSNGAIKEMTANSCGPSSSNCFEILHEHPNDDRLVDQPTDEVSMKMVVTANGILPEVTAPENNIFELQDEVQEINTSYEQFDDQENCGSFINMIVNQVTGDDNMQMVNGDPKTDKLDIKLEPGRKKQKKKARKKLACRGSSNASEDIQFEELFEDLSASIGKFWRQRYLLFSRFDSGIRMDEEGWFSVTPELIARHQASRCAGDVIIDCFTGVGGNAIQFAQRCKHVIAIDVDPKKIEYAYHNASIYGVDDRINFITGNFFVLAPKLKADTVFLSPPWGGPDYAKVKTYNIMTMLRPQDGCSLFNTAKQIAHRVVMFLPRNIDFNQLAELTLSTDHPWSLEVEKNYLNGRLKAVTAYFSDTTVEGKESPTVNRYHGLKGQASLWR